MPAARHASADFPRFVEQVVAGYHLRAAGMPLSPSPPQPGALATAPGGRHGARRTAPRAGAASQPRWGSPRLHWLLVGAGVLINRKRVERHCREEGLAVPQRRRTRLGRSRAAMPAPTGPHERWSMDFVRHTLSSGGVFLVLTVVDEATRESLALEVDTSLAAGRVVL